MVSTFCLARSYRSAKRKRREWALTRYYQKFGSEGTSTLVARTCKASGKLTLPSILGLESARKASITAIVQISATELPASVCAAYQKGGIEPVHFQIEHANLLPIFERFYAFMNRRLQAKKKTLVLEKGGGTACLVAYREQPRTFFPCAIPAFDPTSSNLTLQ